MKRFHTLWTALLALGAPLAAHALPFEATAGGDLTIYSVGAAPEFHQTSDSTVDNGQNFASVFKGQGATGADGTVVSGAIDAFTTPGGPGATPGLHARVEGSATAPSVRGNNPGLIANSFATVKDQFFFSHPGSGVALYALRMTMDADLHIEGGPMTPNNALFISGSILINGNLVPDLMLNAGLHGADEIFGDPSSASSSVNLATPVYLFAGPEGSPFTVEGRLNASLVLFSEKGYPDAIGTIDATQSLHIHLDPVTPGASYTTASGFDYRTPASSVPDSGNTLVMAALSSLGFIFFRRKLPC